MKAKRKLDNRYNGHYKERSIRLAATVVTVDMGVCPDGDRMAATSSSSTSLIAEAKFNLASDLAALAKLTAKLHPSCARICLHDIPAGRLSAV